MASEKYAMCVTLFFLVVSHSVSAQVSNDSNLAPGEFEKQEGSSDQTSLEKGMRPFFDMTRSFLGVIQPNKISQQDWLNLSSLFNDGEFQTDQIDDWQDWALYLVGFLVCVAIGVVFFVAMPIVGLIFCCCRCCGKCGGQTKLEDPKHAGCKRKAYCTILLLLNTVSLAGVVSTFLSNQVLYEELIMRNDAGPVGKLAYSIDSVADFMNETVIDVQKTLLTDFEKENERIVFQIEGLVNDAVENMSNVTLLLAETKDFDSDVQKIILETKNVVNQLLQLMNLSSELNSTLSSILTNVTQDCNVTHCNIRTSDYNVEVNFTQFLGDVKLWQTLNTNVSSSKNISIFFNESETNFKGFNTNISESMTRPVKEATKQIQQTIQNGTDDVLDSVHSATQAMLSVSRDILSVKDDISEYSTYGWYGGLGLSCLLLLIVVLYYFGVLFGLCGERPGEGAPCCNTGIGANFLMAGVGFTFIFSWLIMVVCIVLFATGGPAYTEVCQYFDDHQPSELQPFSDILTHAVDFQDMFGGKTVQLDVVTILEECQDNKPMYSVFKLDSFVNLTEITDITKLEVQLKGLDGGKNIPSISLTILPPGLENALRNLEYFNMSGINFTRYYEELDKNVTAVNLTVLSSQLRTLASNVSLNLTSLNEAANSLDALLNTTVKNMTIAMNSLNQSLTFLEQQQNISVRAQLLLEGLNQSQNSARSKNISHYLTSVSEEVLPKTQEAINNTLTKVRFEIGKCRPVFDSVYSATDGICVATLDPLNGFWFSIGWCLFFFVPCLIFAVKLAGLYRRKFEKVNNSITGEMKKPSGIINPAYSHSGHDLAAGFQHGTPYPPPYEPPSDYDQPKNWQ